MKRVAILLAVLAVLLSSSAWADVVYLNDCRKLEGETKKAGDFVLLTGPFGKLKIKKNDIWKIIKGETPWAKFDRSYKDIATDNATAYCELARWARKIGLKKRAVEAFEAAVKADPEHGEARSALGYEKIKDKWLKGEELLLAKGWKKFNGDWFEPEEFRMMSRTTAEEAKKIVAEIIELLESGDEKKIQLGVGKIKALGPNRSRRFFVKGVRDGKHKGVRLASARALRDFGERREVVNGLLYSTLADNQKDVRMASLESLRELDVPGIVHTYNRALYSQIEDVHDRALDAVDYFRFKESVPHLINVMIIKEYYFGSGAHQYYANIKVEPYIADYEGLIATQAAILDPVIKVFRTGVVLDVCVKTVEIIRRIVGADLGNDPEIWRRYLKYY